MGLGTFPFSKCFHLSVEHRNGNLSFTAHRSHLTKVTIAAIKPSSIHTALVAIKAGAFRDNVALLRQAFPCARLYSPFKADGKNCSSISSSSVLHHEDPFHSKRWHLWPEASARTFQIRLPVPNDKLPAKVGPCQ